MISGLSTFYPARQQDPHSGWSHPVCLPKIENATSSACFLKWLDIVDPGFQAFDWLML